MSGGKTKENAVAAMKTKSDEGMYECFSCGLGEGVTETRTVLEEIEGYYSDVIWM